MTTAPTSYLSEIRDGESVIPVGKRAYFQARLAARLHEMVLTEFLNQQPNGLTQSKIAERIQKRPEQVQRWLASPGNWTLATVSDLLLAISGSELEIAVKPLTEAPRNAIGPEWVDQPATLWRYASKDMSLEAMSPMTTSFTSFAAPIAVGNEHHE